MSSVRFRYSAFPSGNTYSSIAQLVEQVTVNHPVPGSSPGGGVNGLATSVLTSPREKRIGTPTHVREKWDPSRCPSVLFCRISLTHYLRGVAQFGRALALGASGRRFESYHPDCQSPCWHLDYIKSRSYNTRVNQTRRWH